MAMNSQSNQHNKSLLDSISLKDIPAILPALSAAEQERLLAELEKLGEMRTQKLAQEKFLKFVEAVWPTFISGRHHAKMAHAFEKVARGECKRLIINMPPRHTKSEFASYLLPAWFLGNFPHKKIIQTSHTAELAVGFGRKVRNLVDQEVYSKIFPGVGLQADSKAAGRWATNRGGDYFAIGVGGAVTGKGADLLIIDDPHSEQEAALAEINPDIYDKTYEWYTSGPRQRLQPGGAIVVVMCMTGDTPVLMADGTEKPLQFVRAGDTVATFEGGRLTTSEVSNWRSSGVDKVFTVQTQSGRILRANERHPFLVMNEGVLEWTRLNQLRVGDELVALKDATALQGQKLNPECAARAWQKRLGIRNILMRLITPWGTMGSTKVQPVLSRGVLDRRIVTPCANPTTTKLTGHRGNTEVRPQVGVTPGLKLDTESLLNSMLKWLRSAITAVMSAGNSLLSIIPGRTGMENYALTTAIPQGKLEGFYATNATLQSDTERQQLYSNELQRISDFTTDRIIAITPDGEEEVFDVEIARTENFIANGVVSHNTRWSKRDLTGQVLKSAAQRGGEDWEVIEFPAILPSGNPLWPEFWSLKELAALREELPNQKWMAQYQQAPTSETSAIVKRDWWKMWETDTPPPCDFVLMAWDTAFEKSQRADYSALTTWGIFYQPDDTGTMQPNIILLNAFRERMEFPRLKQVALEQYKDWKPDSVIIEKKASGAPLIYELRSMGIPVQEFTPVRGNDKISRLNSVSDVFASGRVWAPNTHWAEEVIEEVASFPGGEHDDYVDSVTLAMMRMRRGGFVATDLDEPEEQKMFKSFKHRGYY